MSVWEIIAAIIVYNYAEKVKVLNLLDFHQANRQHDKEEGHRTSN